MQISNIEAVKFPYLMVSALAIAGGTGQVGAQDLTEVTFGTNWYAQAEHGGFYQAKAEGIYEEYGLDVTIEMGGPQVNGLQLLLANDRDFTMGFPLRNIRSMEDDLPVVTVAAAMQQDPQVLIAHPQVDSFEDIREHEILVGSAADQTYWPWLKQEYGITDAQRKPYTFSVQPFLTNEDIVQQGYLTSEPFAIEKAGIDPNVFLLANYGYPPYATTIETTRSFTNERPGVVRKFVKASMEGWKSYLENPASGNKLIQMDNPDMTDEQLAYSFEKMQEYELITGGEAEEMGIGVMTHERWRDIHEFMVDNEMITEDLNWRKAYTLEFLPDASVMPSSR